MRGSGFVGGVLGCVAGAALVGIVLARSGAAKEPKPSELKTDIHDNVDLAANWIYDDIDKGLAAARAGNKPLLVVLRCVP